MKVLRHQLRLFFVALQFLTRLPVPRWVGYDAQWLPQATRYFALVGALVGGFGAAVALAALQLWPPAVAAALAVAATLWLSAALHEDGLADTCDALFGAAPRERALAIMKDARIGSYGAAALCLSLLLRVLLLAALLARDPRLAAAACVAAHCAGRGAAVALMAWLPYAGDASQAKARPLAGGQGRAEAGWALLSAAAALALAGLAVPALAQAAAAAGGLALLLLTLRGWLRRRLGGHTGDTLGAAEQLGEAAVLLAFAATWAR
jgi:adenosylcobinamide-GDP ribazoletransferase